MKDARVHTQTRVFVYSGAGGSRIFVYIKKSQTTSGDGRNKGFYRCQNKYTQRQTLLLLKRNYPVQLILES